MKPHKEGGCGFQCQGCLDEAAHRAWNEAIEAAARMVYRGVDDDALVERVRSLKKELVKS